MRASPALSATSSDKSTMPSTANLAPFALIAATSLSASGSGKRLIRSIFSATTFAGLKVGHHA